MSSFLVDTDVLISYTKHHHAAIELVQRVTLEDDQATAATSAITVYELLEGLRQPEKHAIRRLLGTLRCLPVTGPVAHAAALLAREGRHSGRQLSVGDALIAATALLHNLVLVTHNRKHFDPLGVRLYPELISGDEGQKVT